MIRTMKLVNAAVFLFCLASPAAAGQDQIAASGQVPGRPFVYLQQQLDDLSSQCDPSVNLDEYLALVQQVASIMGKSGKCLTNTNCPPDEYCEKKAGDCESVGKCVVRPEFCIKIYQPVCGCDGITYGNDCEAAAAGASVNYEGPCQPTPSPTCQTNIDCETDAFCDKKEGDCDGVGTCQPQPTACIELYAPVCGCDGLTYSNECFADAAGVNVLHQGACDPSTQGCTDNFECAADEFCQKIEGDCDTIGKCAPTPSFCLDLWDPVCGCDGITYSNSCYAWRAGVNIVHNGECGTVGTM